MAFSERPWAARFGELGDLSERKFVEFVEGHTTRWGLERPEGVHVPSLPKRIAQTPDYLCNHRFVECMGLGRAQMLQMKHTKFCVLRYWNDLHAVAIWVWDSHKKRSCLISIEAVDKLINTPDLCEVKFFDNAKMVFAIPADAVFEAADLDRDDL